MLHRAARVGARCSRASPLSSRQLSTRATSVLGPLSLDSSSAVQPGVFDGSWRHGTGEELTSYDPATGEVIGKVAAASDKDVQQVLAKCREAFEQWRTVPAPKRGEVLRDIGNALRGKKKELGGIVTLEMGKILPEGLGEVQEAIDVCDYAVGLSRIVPGGRIIPSERPAHFLQEVAHPLGTVGVLTAFNFPEAVFAWNASLSFITGNATVWKPAPSTPLTAIATTKIVAAVLEAHKLPGALAALVCGGAEAGSAIVDSPLVDLVSFTGSEATGRKVGEKIQNRFGKVLLELGGNNAAVVMPSASLDLALRAIVFGSVGTAGQRCTSTRRVLVHKDVADEFVERPMLNSKIASATGWIRRPWSDRYTTRQRSKSSNKRSRTAKLRVAKSWPVAQDWKCRETCQKVTSSAQPSSNGVGSRWVANRRQRSSRRRPSHPSFMSGLSTPSRMPSLKSTAWTKH